MSRATRGLIIAALHVMLVASLGGKMLYDRATLPRVWVLAAPYDPDLPIRGRYVSLQLVVEARGIIDFRQPPLTSMEAVALRVDGDRLVAERKAEQAHYNSSDLHLRITTPRGEKLVVLDKPIAFFIPEHIQDPSRRSQGEELWVEVTVPPKGPPRPIRLGVKKGDAPIVPLQIG